MFHCMQPGDVPVGPTGSADCYAVTVRIVTCDQWRFTDKLRTVSPFNAVRRRNIFRTSRALDSWIIQTQRNALPLSSHMSLLYVVVCYMFRPSPRHHSISSCV
jgi:hypothetical protein